MDCPANCLQPLGQNDNGWNQGQLFVTPDRVWGMPPYYAQQMAARNYQPLRVASEVTGRAQTLDVTATKREDGTVLVLKVVNVTAAAQTARLRIDGFGASAPRGEAWTLTGELSDVNTPEHPEAVRWVRRRIDAVASSRGYTFPARSYTILRLHR
jgi:alpha-L-arabinofuranosidase